MLTIAAPALQTMVMNNRISTAASDLMVDLTYARATAIQRGVRVGMCRSTSLTACDGTAWEQGWMIYTDAASDGYTSGTDTILRVREALSGALTIAPTPAAASVLFRPSGPADAARTFRLCAPGYVGRDISISTTGRVESAVMTSACS
jgi:type IV fimbrial biogenesis protein FimT